MRRVGKQIVAITLAAAMMGSLTPEACTFLQNEVVYAAETEKQVWASADRASLVFDAGTDAKWTDKAFASNDTKDQPNAVRLENVNVGTTVKVKAKVKVSDTTGLDGSKDANESYNAIQLASAVQSGSSWKYAKSDDYPFLKEENFKDGEATVTFTYVAEAGALQSIIFQYNASEGFKGTITISDVEVYDVVESESGLTEQEPTVLSDLNNESQAAQWKGEEGWAYFHGGTANAAPEVSYDANNGDGRLKVGLNYSANSAETWSEAKVKFTPEQPANISNYNQLSVDLIYPENSNIKKMKFFSEGGISKDCSINTSTAEDAGNGYKKVTVTMDISPSTTPLKDVTIGLIGVSSNFVGDVYLDNLTLSQKDDSADYTKITSQPDANGTQAVVKTTDKTLTMTDPDADDSAKALYAYLQGLTESDQVLFGHQNDVSRSVGTKDALGDVHDVTGSVSGIFGIDSLALFGSEAGGTDAKSALENSINYSKKAADNGAIVTLSAHMPNFTSAKIKDNGDGTYDFFDCNFNESKDLSGDSLKKILPGGEKNKVFTAYLDTIATYANKLQELNIPVIFRPLHENTGGWFWWGTGNTAESYKSLYAYTREYLESKGVHNMLYVYSPNGPMETEEEYMSRYPGDAYVDILAFDYYNDFNTYPAEADTSFFAHLDQTCQVVSSIAKKHDKLAAISETGVRVMKENGSDNEGLLVKNNPVSEAKTGKNWYEEVNNIAKKNDMPYYMVWANFSDTNFYVPYKHTDTMGQEMINEFIDYYNNEDSVFGNGTNFYDNIDKYAGVKTDNYKDVSGYMVAPFDMDTILKPTALKASVSNAGEVSFVVKDTAKGKQLTLPAAKGSDGFYTAQLTQKEMDQIGKTDVASITLVADGKELSTITNLSIGKEKEKAPAGVLENFDYYVGSNGLLDAAYGGNSAAGCSSSFTLDQEHKADGTYGAAFNYKLKTTGSEVWTGLVNASLGNTDFSAYNALKFWTKLDGKGQKVVVQIKAGGEEYEVYLTNLAKTEDAYEVTVPFSAFKGKTGGKLSGDALKDVQAFGLWCNSNPAGSAVDVESVLYFDAFKGTTISDAEAAKADADGLIAVKQTSQSGNNGGNSSSGSSTSGGNSGSTTTPDTGNTTPDTKPSETRKTDKTFENIAKDTNATLTVEKNDKGEVTGARAQLDKTVKNASETKKTTISADVVAKLVQEAGTSDISITQTTKNASGKVMNSVSVNAKDLQAGKKLTLVKVDKKTGEKVLISSRTYKVSKDGTVTADTKDAGDYVLLNEKDAKALSSKILKSVALKDTKKTVANGKKAKVTFDKNLNMENVKNITYTSSKKSVVTVNKNGTIVAKKAGKAVVKVKVTLKNGKTKTVKMTIKVTK